MTKAYARVLILRVDLFICTISACAEPYNLYLKQSQTQEKRLCYIKIATGRANANCDCKFSSTTLYNSPQIRGKTDFGSPLPVYVGREVPVWRFVIAINWRRDVALTTTPLHLASYLPQIRCLAIT